MATFYYRTTKTMEPRIGVRYATVYIKQDIAEYERLKSWLVQIAQDIISISQIDADCADWFTKPMADFRRSQRGEYYSPEDIITDMIDQMMHGRDLTEAMIGRWNRLTEGTPWHIELLSTHDTTPQPQVRSPLFA
jgi:hypothetical protein